MSLKELFPYQRRRSGQYIDRAYRFLSRNKVMAILTIGPALLLFTFINVLPIVWAILGSFNEISIYSAEWTWTGLSHYRTTLFDPAFWDSMWLSLIFAGGSVSFQLVFGIAIALIINESFKFNNVVRGVVLLPYLVPTAILGFVALWMGNSSWGIINQLLWQLGIIETYVPWFGHADWAMIAVILTSSWKFTIFVTLMVLARLQGIPEDYYEAAKMAGAGFWRRFWDITIPNLKGIIFIVVLLRGIWMFNKFDIIYVLTEGGPGDATRVAPIYAYETLFGVGSMGRAAAISVILFLILGVGAIIYFVILNPSQEVRVE